MEEKEQPHGEFTLEEAQRFSERIKSFEILPSHESGIRRLTAEAEGELYDALHSLEKAQEFSDAVVIFEGDCGGQIYLTCPASKVKCSEETLKELLKDVDAYGWDEISMRNIFYECHQIGSGISGGMGGGVVTEGVWIHEDLVQQGLSEQIKAVLEGRSSKL